MLMAATCDSGLARTLRGVSRALDAEVRLVVRGRELLSLMADPRCPDILALLLDEELLDGAGRSLLPTLHRIRPDLKILFVASPEAEIEARREGIYFFLLKPVDAAILSKVVAKAIEHETTRKRWGVV